MDSSESGRRQFLKTFAISRTLARLSLIAIHDRDPIHRPAEGNSPLFQSILSFPALGILQDLTRRRLADIEESPPLKMTRAYLFRCFHCHIPFASACPNAIEAKMRTTSPCRADGQATGAVGGMHRPEETATVVEQAFIQAAMPCPSKRARPHPSDRIPSRTCRRNSS